MFVIMLDLFKDSDLFYIDWLMSFKWYCMYRSIREWVIQHNCKFSSDIACYWKFCIMINRISYVSFRFLLEGLTRKLLMICSESLLLHSARLSLWKYQLEEDVVLYNTKKGNFLMWFVLVTATSDMFFSFLFSPYWFENTISVYMYISWNHLFKCKLRTRLHDYASIDIKKLLNVENVPMWGLRNGINEIYVHLYICGLSLPAVRCCFMERLFFLYSVQVLFDGWETRVFYH